MPIPLVALQAGANIASGLISTISGSSQIHKANKLLGGLQYPIEELPDEYNQNKSLAEQMAATGMPSEQYNQAMRNIQRQQLTAMRYANDRRGGLAVLPSILQGTNDATLNLDSLNSQQRIANKRQLMNVNTQIGGVKRDLFDKNIRDKYNRDYNYGMTLLGVGNQNLAGGLDKLATGGLTGIGSFGKKTGG